MTQSTCPAHSPYFQLNKRKGVRKAKPHQQPHPQHAQHRHQPRTGSDLPPHKGLCSAEANKQHFRKTLSSALLGVSQSKQLRSRSRPGSGEATPAARQRLFRYSRYFPTTRTCWATCSRAGIKTPSARGCAPIHTHLIGS